MLKVFSNLLDVFLPKVKFMTCMIIPYRLVFQADKIPIEEVFGFIAFLTAVRRAVLFQRTLETV